MAKTLQLSVKDIDCIYDLLRNTHLRNPDGSMILQVYSNKLLCGVHHFKKNTSEVYDAYTKLYKERRKEIVKKYEVEEKQAKLNELVKLIRNADEKDEGFADIKKKYDEAVNEFTEARNKSEEEIGNHPELLKAVKEDKHDIEIREITIEAIEHALENREFTSDEAPVIEIIDRVLALK